MKPYCLVGSSRRLWTALAIALVLVMAVAGLAAAGGGGAARWAALGITAGDGVIPTDIAGPDDFYIMAFSGSGSLTPNCDADEPVHYTRGDAIFYWAAHECYVRWYSSATSGQPAGLDINALHDECGPTDPGCDIYLSFAQNTARIAGVGPVRGQDIVKAVWSARAPDEYESFSLAFDGSDVGLTTPNERIDALFMYDLTDIPRAYGDCGGLLLLSTVGAYRVADQWGGALRGGGEDVLGFCVASMGWDTVGYWFVYHDGSAEGLPRNALIGFTHEEGQKAFDRFNFLTAGRFAADQANGGHSEVYEFFGQTGQYRGPLFSFPDDLGLTDKVDSFHIFYTE